jgi:hypothetical protein
VAGDLRQPNWHFSQAMLHANDARMMGIAVLVSMAIFQIQLKGAEI